VMEVVSIGIKASTLTRLLPQGGGGMLSGATVPTGAGFRQRSNGMKYLHDA
jgi:hypothetical protein